MKAKIRYECIEELEKTNNNKKINDEWRILKNLKNKDVVYSHPDKGKGTVVMDRAEYNNLMETHIATGPYELYKTRAKNPVDKIQDEVRKAINDLIQSKVLDTYEGRNMLVKNPRIPRISGLPKIHKIGSHIRPVVTNIDAPASRIAKYLVKKFRTYKRPQHYEVKNFKDLVSKLENEQVGDDEEVVSLDVVSLYPSIPKEESTNMLKEWVCEQDDSDEEALKIWELIDIVVKQGTFQYDNKVYKQTSGVAIGCSLSPWLAEIFLTNLENKFMQQPWAPRLYYRYVDDCVAIIKKGQAETILQELNSLHQNIKFTCERQKEGKLPFLDLMLTVENNKFSFDIYRKETDTMQSIPADSFHPLIYKRAAFESMIHRMLNVPLDENARTKEESHIKKIATVNGYETEMIDRIIEKRTRRKEQKNLTTLQRQETEHGKKKILIMSYHPPMSDKIIRIAKRNGINACYRSRGSLADNIINLKDKRKNEDKSGIYQVNCDDCETKYIGQSVRRMEKRWQEHERALRLKQPSKSAIAEHCINEGHKMGTKKLIKEVTNGSLLNSWESYYITNTEDSCNKDDATIKSRLYTIAHDKLRK
jgi:hypothetical protein